jgi:acetoacetyl-CoA synthetase
LDPLWTASLERRQNARLTAFARAAAETAVFAENFDYAGLHRWSLAQRETFWSRLWDFCGVIGAKGARVTVDGERMPGARWFPDARLNFAQNLLRPRALDEAALIFADERKGRRSLTYAQLLDEVVALADHFSSLGVAPGDRVAAYVHNGPEAVIGMLAAASIGAVWASCSPDFGPAGVLDRFAQIAPKILIASDGYFYKGEGVVRLEQAREIAGALPGLQEALIIPYIGAGSPLAGFAHARLWPEALAAHAGAAPSFVSLPFDHPLCVMFSSGTTGAPKCIVHGAGGVLLQHLKEHQLHCDIRPGDRVFYAMTTGWMMWNWLASALASGATLLLYDGFAMDRDGRALLDFVQDERASFFGVSAGYLKAIEKQRLTPRETHDLAALRLIASTGSPLPPESFDYVYRDVKPDVQLASISGGTDILSCFVLGNPWSPVMRGEIQGAGLGMAVEVWDAAGARVFGQEGELVCTKPFPSTPIGFWNDPEGAPRSGEAGQKYRSAYFSWFPNVWRHGDYATQTASGFVIHGRSDSTLNPQGVRIGTADIYRIVENMPEVEEALAVAQDWEGTERVLLFVRLGSGHCLEAGLDERIRRKLKHEASPRHVPAKIFAAPELPHTRSGKLVELAVRDIIHGRPIKNLEALANPHSLEFFVNLAALRALSDRTESCDR